MQRSAKCEKRQRCVRPQSLARRFVELPGCRGDVPEAGDVALLKLVKEGCQLEHRNGVHLPRVRWHLPAFRVADVLLRRADQLTTSVCVNNAGLVRTWQYDEHLPQLLQHSL